ncbi:hypothetical protein GMO_09540 [Gluconobacter morbifer G707]|uniref:Uncharacterized protein n=1 Tax=Gluconobacter morbifer G707 TaxID=1088869 RepID=G6XHI8_9PROT|nr:hypothetical protein GMO_09540 [Gluconobacter morbifer G707]
MIHNEAGGFHKPASFLGVTLRIGDIVGSTMSAGQIGQKDLDTPGVLSADIPSASRKGGKQCSVCPDGSPTSREARTRCPYLQ